MEMRSSWSWNSLNIPMALQLGGGHGAAGMWVESGPGSSNHGKGLGRWVGGRERCKKTRKRGGGWGEMCSFCPHPNRGFCVLKGPLGSCSLSRRAETGGRWRIWGWGATGSRKCQSFHKKARQWGGSQESWQTPKVEWRSLAWCAEPLASQSPVGVPQARAAAPPPPNTAFFSTHDCVSTVTCQWWPNIHGPRKDEYD
uniref:Uncharacterized protein n=1 Tax=Myotis myotis TaxID=51298 RepID=A0A7J7T5M6_MYOMY|nr:hypothetical protein mMyoMyo1_009141 [Myotis myotis]